MFKYFKDEKWANYIGLIVLIVVIFGIQIYFFQQLGVGDGDYKYHLDLTNKMIQNNSIISKDIPPHVSAHPLYHILTIIFSKITDSSLNVTGYYLVPLLSYIILGLVLYKAFVKEIIRVDNNDFSLLGALIITLCLMLVGPVSFFSYPNLYLGYIGISVYHSPTQILVKPLSLITFLLLIKGLSRRTSSKGFKVCLALVTALSLMAKPSYLICLIPALILFSMLKLCNFYKNESMNLNLIFFFLAVNGLVLAWQYWLTFGTNDPDYVNKIMFAPFLVMRYYAHNSLLLRLMASVLFPLTVYLVFFDSAKKDITLNLAWLTFGISLFYTYFLALSYCWKCGDFAWGSQISLFILFVTSTIFLIKEKNFRINKELLFIKKDPRLSLCVFTFSLHLLSGLLYYFKILYGGWFG